MLPRMKSANVSIGIALSLLLHGLAMLWWWNMTPPGAGLTAHVLHTLQVRLLRELPPAPPPAAGNFAKQEPAASDDPPAAYRNDTQAAHQRPRRQLRRRRPRRRIRSPPKSTSIWRQCMPVWPPSWPKTTAKRARRQSANCRPSPCIDRTTTTRSARRSAAPPAPTAGTTSPIPACWRRCLSGDGSRQKG